MNKACSAGTGSFLEEQSLFYGVEDIGEFTRLAMSATRPPELGQMCTVFVADAAAEAHNEGFEVHDLFAGFQYSVIHNYINRVMGQRTFGQRIFFQGKPASGTSLAWTLAAVTGREVVVPPNPGAMGAWGIGLCAIDELGADALAAAPGFELELVLGAEVVGKNEFSAATAVARDALHIARTRVAVLGGDRPCSRGACPTVRSGVAAREAPKEAPSAFDERAGVAGPHLEERGRPRSASRWPAPASASSRGWWSSWPASASACACSHPTVSRSREARSAVTRTTLARR
jgi:hypothetical protein